MPSDSNVTAAAVQALLAVGYPRTGRRVQRTLTALRRFRNADGGYGLNRGNRSDSQSTAWAVQALVAAGRRPDAALAYLRRQQRADGALTYSTGLAHHPGVGDVAGPGGVQPPAAADPPVARAPRASSGSAMPHTPMARNFARRACRRAAVGTARASSSAPPSASSSIRAAFS